MTKVTRSDFKNITSSLYPSNIKNAISAKDLRQQMDNIVDSAAFVTEKTSVPGASDDDYFPGDIWIDTNANIAYVCRSNATGNAVWSKIGLSGNDIKTLYESEPNTNAFTDADKTKLDSVESGANNLDGSEIKTLYESEPNTNAFTDGEKSKLLNIEPNATFNREEFVLAASDETTAIETGTRLVTFRPRFRVIDLEVGASLSNPSAVGDVIVDINKNGTSILSTKITIDQGDSDSINSVTQPVLSDTDWLAYDEISVDIDAAGTEATGLKVYISGLRE